MYCGVSRNPINGIVLVRDVPWCFGMLRSYGTQLCEVSDEIPSSMCVRMHMVTGFKTPRNRNGTNPASRREKEAQTMSKCDAV